MDKKTNKNGVSIVDKMSRIPIGKSLN